MSAYTHCRGCGAAIDFVDATDGLCSRLLPGGDYSLEVGCTHDCMEWLKAQGKPVPPLMPNVTWDSALWTVAIDEWLAATR